MLALRGQELLKKVYSSFFDIFLQTFLLKTRFSKENQFLQSFKYFCRF